MVDVAMGKKLYMKLNSYQALVKILFDALFACIVIILHQVQVYNKCFNQTWGLGFRVYWFYKRKNYVIYINFL
jgi:hypothetical protein